MTTTADRLPVAEAAPVATVPPGSPIRFPPVSATAVPELVTVTPPPPLRTSTAVVDSLPTAT